MSEMSWLTGLGIALCLSQSALFSGLNLGMLGPSRLRLQVAASGGNPGAQQILALRQDFHLLLATLLWGNVAVNTLLALLAESALTGVAAFVFSTVGITIFGEILPQAYISRHAYLVGGALAPVVRIYLVLLYPLAWPTARLLDRMVGTEGLGLFREEDLREILQLHIRDDDSDVSMVEGRGALNFLALDDRSLREESEPLHPDSILSLPFDGQRPRFPDFGRARDDAFIASIHASGHKWAVLTDQHQTPRLVLEVDAFLRAVLMDESTVDPLRYCHEPYVVADPTTKLEAVLGEIELLRLHPDGQALHPNLILLWTAHDKRVLSGVDLLENLLRGVSPGDQTAR